MEAEVIPFPRRPVPVKSCSDCEWAAFSTYGTHCLQLREDIWNEDWAEDCELFDPISRYVPPESPR